MNKVLKGLVAVAATAAMAVAGFAGASTAMAVDGNTVNVTVPGAESNLNGHAYTAHTRFFLVLRPRPVARLAMLNGVLVLMTLPS